MEHSLQSFKEGQSTVLVIKDKDILDSDNEDVLHSVTIQDKEKSKKNLEIKRRGIGYKCDYGVFILVLIFIFVPIASKCFTFLIIFN